MGFHLFDNGCLRKLTAESQDLLVDTLDDILHGWLWSLRPHVQPNLLILISLVKSNLLGGLKYRLFNFLLEDANSWIAKFLERIGNIAFFLAFKSFLNILESHGFLLVEQAENSVLVRVAHDNVLLVFFALCIRQSYLKLA